MQVLAALLLDLLVVHVSILRPLGIHFMMVHIHLKDLLYLKIVFRSTLRIIVLS